MFKKILVPLDGSEIAETVLPFVQEIAKNTQGEIVLVTAIAPGGAWDATLSLQVLDKEEVVALEYLKEQATKLGSNVTMQVARGEAAAASPPSCTSTESPSLVLRSCPPTVLDSSESLSKAPERWGARGSIGSSA